MVADGGQRAACGQVALGAAREDGDATRIGAAGGAVVQDGGEQREGRLDTHEVVGQIDRRVPPVAADDMALGRERAPGLRVVGADDDEDAAREGRLAGQP